LFKKIVNRGYLQFSCAILFADLMGFTLAKAAERPEIKYVIRSNELVVAWKR
jgi:hypothetical protein